MNKPLKIVVIILAVFLVLHIVKNTTVKVLAQSAMTGVMHVPVNIGSLNLSLLASKIDIKNMRIQNPSGYKERVMVDLRQIKVDFNPWRLPKGEVHFEEVRIDLKEIVVVKNKDGKLNVDALKSSKKEATKGSPKKPSSSKKAPKMRIDEFYLTVGKVVYKDYSQGGAPKEEVFEIGIKDRKYTNIQDPSMMVSLVMFEALTRHSLSKIAALDMGYFKDGASNALSEGLGIVGDGAKGFEEVAKSLFGSLK